MCPTASVNQVLSNLGESATGNLAMIEKISGKKARAVRGCLNDMLGSGQTEKGDISVQKIQERAHNLLWHQEKEFLLAAKQSIPYTTVPFYGDCGKIRPEIWRQTNWLLHHDSAPSHTFFFIREFLTKST
jgi:hypothetical protein